MKPEGHPGPPAAAARPERTPCAVVQCACGDYHVRIGATSVKVSPATMRELARALACAAAHEEQRREARPN